MAKTYTSTIQIRCWKEHTCVDCGAAYSYEFIRSIAGRGGTAERAEAKAQKNVADALEHDVDMQPCPMCGLYQPDMVARPRARKHTIFLVLAAILLGVLLIVRAARGMQADTATWAIAAACVVAAALNAKIALANPNADLNANRQLAAERVAQQIIRHKPGAPSITTPQSVQPRSGLAWAGLVLLPLAVLAASAPEIMRTLRGWPLNHESYPPVAGPGDRVRLYMNQKITSIKGLWRGSAQEIVREEGSKDRGTRVPASTNQNDWGNTISAKSSEKNSSNSPWIEATLPDLESLVGKTVTVDLELHVQYPRASGPSTFDTIENTLQRTVGLRLASPHAGQRYTALWWEATAGAITAVLLGTFLLIKDARALERQAKPNRVMGDPDAAAAPQPPTPAV